MLAVSTFLTWLTAPLFGEPRVTISLESYLQNAQTGDIILMSSHSAGQLMQRFFTFSRYSHIAVVVRDKNGGVWLWHSSIHVNARDSLTGNTHDGPQLSDAREMIRGYAASGGYLVAMRRLMDAEEVPDANMLEARLVHHCIRKLAGTEYDGNFLRLFSGYFTELHHTPFGDVARHSDRAFYCSELVAASLIVMGIVDEKRNFDDYAPVDFGETWPTLPLKKPYYYGREIKILF